MRVVIVGASVRAAAESARRAGLEVVGIDRFGDLDLAAVGTAWRVERGSYPEGLAALAASAPAGAWMYTGAIENHPALVDRIAAGRVLWGNPGAVLRAVRDPEALARAMAGAGLPFARVWDLPRGLPRDGSILVKPRASGGGRAIRALGVEMSAPGEPVYYQERLDGASFGAVFVARRAGGPTALAGLTAHWAGAGFGWRGCVGPLEVSRERGEALGRIGSRLAEVFGLAGLFGVDLVEHGGALVPVEVNPRYTASVEVLERATGRRLLAEHRGAFEGSGPERWTPGEGRAPGVVGKVIVTAPGSVRAPKLDGWVRVGEDERVATIADVPPEGTRFEAGEPVLTLIQRDSSLEGCRARLGRRLAGWQARLRRPPWAGGEVGR